MENITKTFHKVEIDDLDSLTKDKIQHYSYSNFCRKAHNATGRINKNMLYFHGKKKCVYPYCRNRLVNELQKDHIVPISVAYFLNWSLKETRSFSNIQLLCDSHHKIKDANVKHMSNVAMLKRGIVLPL